ncbi:MAG: type II toxin-antitoxin system PemK/MazF family toxin [Actinomycetota bacterium]
MRQGEIWWVEQPDEKRRPHLVLTRDAALPVLRAVLAAPLTRTVRGLPTEVALGAADQLAIDCVANLHNVRLIDRAAFTARIGTLGAGRWHEVCMAMRAAIDC